MDLVLFFIQKTEVKLHLSLSFTNDFLPIYCDTLRAGIQLLLNLNHILLLREREREREIGYNALVLLFCHIETPLTSISLFFSLFLPIELLPLLAVSRAGITDVWWRGILAGLQVANL
jgi:hypothetical protein